MEINEILKYLEYDSDEFIIEKAVEDLDWCIKSRKSKYVFLIGECDDTYTLRILVYKDQYIGQTLLGTARGVAYHLSMIVPDMKYKELDGEKSNVNKIDIHKLLDLIESNKYLEMLKFIPQINDNDIVFIYNDIAAQYPLLFCGMSVRYIIKISNDKSLSITRYSYHDLLPSSVNIYKSESQNFDDIEYKVSNLIISDLRSVYRTLTNHKTIGE